MNTVKSTNRIGDFELVSGVVRISDPCYDKSTSCAGTIDNCQTGKWHSKVINSDEGDWGDRVAYLIAWHESTKEPNDVHSGKWDIKDIEVGVDSGQAGIFDDKYFKDDDSINGVERVGGSDNHPVCEDKPWYSICCDRTLSDIGAGVIPFGCLSSSGYGDGSYNVYSMNDGHNVVAIMIDYGLDYEEDENEELLEECEECGCEFEPSEIYMGLCEECNEAKTYLEDLDNEDE